MVRYHTTRSTRSTKLNVAYILQQMPFYPRKAFRGKKGMKSRATKRSAPTPSKALTKAVTTVIKRKQETKYISDSLFNNSASPTTLATFVGFSSGITSTAEMYCCMPRIIQGTGDHNRVGNVIQPTSLKVKGIVSLQTNLNTSAHCSVDVYFLTSKQVKTELLYASVLINKLLNKGDGTNTNYTGKTYEAQFPVNLSEFTVIKHKRIILQRCRDSPNAIADSDESATSIAPNYSRPFVVDIPLPKSLTYQADGNTLPASFYPFMVLGWNYGDNNGGSASNDTAQVFCQAQSQLYYKDA